MYCLTKKDLYDKGWRGQFPPFGFEKSFNDIFNDDHTAPKILDLVGTKLGHISPIEKMTK